MERDGGRRPLVSVVIPALNEERHLELLLSDLQAQTRGADEVLVVDAGSEDRTASVAREAGADLLEGSPPVALGRNEGGYRAEGNVLIFLDADVRIGAGFLEGFLAEFESRGLDVACPKYVPHRSTRAIRGIFVFFNLLFKACEGFLPSGAGHCIAVRGDLFRNSRGFDPDLKFDDAELIRRLSRGCRFGIISEEEVHVSDRRYRESGVATMLLRYLLMSLLFAVGRYTWANRINYEFGGHKP